MKFVHVQSVLPEEDIIALKIKTGEKSVKDAISKAIYYYLSNYKNVENLGNLEEGVEEGGEGTKLSREGTKLSREN